LLPFRNFSSVPTFLEMFGLLKPPMPSEFGVGIDINWNLTSQIKKWSESKPWPSLICIILCTVFLDKMLESHSVPLLNKKTKMSKGKRLKDYSVTSVGF